eukprot:CCRYP_017763-RA/>CCRYP_017763-RA protein AED:0.37 eAED:0.18 QI:0/0/0/1/1/1/2/0/848
MPHEGTPTNPDIPKVPSSNLSHVSKTLSMADTIPATNDHRRRQCIRRQRDRWRRCVLRHQQRLHQQQADVDLLDCLLCDNEQPRPATALPNHSDSHILDPTSSASILSEEDSVLYLPPLCHQSNSSDDSNCVSSMASSSTDDHDDASTLSEFTDVYSDFSNPPPPGSLLSYWDKPISAGTFSNFPELFTDQCKVSTMFEEAATTQPMTPDSSIDSTDSTLTAPAPTLTCISTTSRIVGIQDDLGELIDSGGNFNMCNDLSILVNVTAIRPFGVNMATSSAQSSTSCTHRGDFAIPMLDGSVLYTPMYYNSSASDCILSPEAVCHSSNGFLASWCQTGSINEGSGSIALYDHTGTCQIRLNLTKHNGLYYFRISSIALDKGPQDLNLSGNRTIYIHETQFEDDDDISLELDPTASASHGEHPVSDPCKPPMALLNLFLDLFGSKAGGSIRCDQGGKLARSHEFVTAMSIRKYSVEPTGADNASQNKAVEKWNDVLGITVRVLLCGSGLPATFWSAALLHAAFLHNRRVHRSIMMTPFEAWHGIKPDLRKLRVFGSRVCVKRTGKRRSKLNRHDFTGIFLGYTAKDENIQYVDVDTRRVKQSHHVIFDEAWYLQPRQPPFAQMLYDIGLEALLSNPISAPPSGPPPHAVYPPLCKPPPLPLKACHSPLPLRLTPAPFHFLHAAAAKTTTGMLQSDITVLGPTPTTSRSPLDHEMMAKHDISSKDMEMVHLSPSPFTDSFEEVLQLRYFDPLQHPTAGMVYNECNGRIYLTNIEPSTPAAKLRAWRSRLRGAWLIKINDTTITCESDVKKVLLECSHTHATKCTLLLAYSAIRDGLVETGIPQINADQLNH